MKNTKILHREIQDRAASREKSRENLKKTTGRFKAIGALSIALVVMLLGSAVTSLFASTDTTQLATSASGAALIPSTGRSNSAGSNSSNASASTELLKQDATYWELSLGGNPIAIMPTEEEAKSVVQYIAKRYSEPGAVSVAIEPAITVEAKTFKKGEPAPEITEDGTIIAEKLLKGNETSVEYVVKDGDTLWDIAVNHDIDIDTLVGTNPSLDVENIHPGDKLVLVEGKADVEVRVITETKEEVEIEFETEYQESEELADGEEIVVTEGVPGTKTATMRTVKVNGIIKLKEEVSSETTKEPVNKVVKVGIGAAPNEDDSEDESNASESSESSASDESSYSESSDDSDYEEESYSEAESESSYSSGAKQAIVDAAYAQLGVDQDCTALVSNSLAAAGINFHSGPMGFTSLGSWTSNPEPGDICIYDTHVAIYIGGGQAVHGGWWGDGYRTTAIWSVYTSWPTFLGYIHLDI